MPRPVTQDVTKQHKLQNVANVIKEQRRGGSSLRLMNLDLWWKMFLYAFATAHGGEHVPDLFPCL